MMTYRVTLGANLQDLFVQPDRESAERRSKTVIGVAKHDDRLDSAVQLPWDIICGGVHNPRSLRVADQGKGLAGAGCSLGLEAVHNILGALIGARDDL
jgi:hypothetical protein